MLEEYEKQKRKRLATMKSLMDYGMGFIILVIGLVFSSEINLEIFL